MLHDELDKAVIGAGTMGSGIALSLALAGYKVLLFDRFSADPGIRLRAEANIRRFLFITRNVQRGETFNRIRFLDIDTSAEMRLMGGCDAVIEAIYENLEEKKKLYHLIRSMDVVSGTSPISIYSNTSTIRCEHLIEGLEHPEYFMILHFFSPVPMSKIVEFVPHKKTGEETINLGHEIVKRMNKKVGVAPDIPGFVANRILLPMLQSFGEKLDQGSSENDIDEAFKNGTWQDNNDAREIVEVMIKSAEQLVNDNQKQSEVPVTPEMVDEILVLGTGFPAGPFGLKKNLAGEKTDILLKFKMGPGQLADFVGIDVARDCLRMLEIQEPGQWSTPHIFETMAGNRKLGIKSGEGFYTYEVTAKLTPTKNYGDYATVTIESPSLSRSVIKRLTKTFQSLKEKTISGVIIEIEKIKGADVCEFPSALSNQDFLKEIIGEWHELMKTINNFPAPVIAVVRVSALGGGYELALACDYIVAEKRTKVGLPELRLGILPGGGGTQNLPRKAGLEKSLWMILGGEIVEASTPWVDEVIDSPTSEYLEKLLDQVQKMDRRAMRFSGEEWAGALKIVEGRRDDWGHQPPSSFDSAQDAILEGTQKNFEDGLAYEIKAIFEAFKAPDAKEGILHFLEHGKHKFQIV